MRSLALLKSVYLIVRYLRLILRNPEPFLAGWDEAHSSFGLTYDDPFSDRSFSYDLGRNLRRGGRA